MVKPWLAMTKALPRSIVRHHRANDRIFLYAFDLIELTATTCGVIHLRAARPR
jgi:hypothetical protein